MKTPFGRRSLSLAMVASQASARDFAGEPGNSETVVHKSAAVSGTERSQRASRHRSGAIGLACVAILSSGNALTLRSPIGAPTTKTGRGAPASSYSREIGNCAIRAHGMAAGDAAPSRGLVDARLDHSPGGPTANAMPEEGRGARSKAPSADLTPLVARAEETRPAEDSGASIRRSDCCANGSRCYEGISSR